jgi:hypothetical protein
MSALITQPRHLDLPLGALFRPEELVIGPSTTAAEYQQLGAGLSRIATADKLWQCDYALWGKKKFGAEEGLTLAAESTGLSTSFLERCARIAERFDPSRRYPNMTREHYRGLCCFPASFTDSWLPTVCGKGLSARSLRALAVEAFGSDPMIAYSKKKKRSVSISPALWARLSEKAPTGKVCIFIETILSDFLVAQAAYQRGEETPEQKLERLRRANAEKQRRWKAAHKPAATTYHDNLNVVRAAEAVGNDEPEPVGARPSDSPAPADVSAQPKTGRWRAFTEARDFCRSLNLSGIIAWRTWISSGQRPADIPCYPQDQYAEFAGYPDFLGYSSREQSAAAMREREASKAAKHKQAQAAKREAAEQREAAKREKAEQREAARASYETRRKQQIAEGAEPIKKKFKAVKTHELRLQWVPCAKSSSENGVVTRLAKSQKADCFPTLEDAHAAEEKYFQEKGYRNEIVYCGVPCGAYHVKHAYSSEQ